MLAIIELADLNRMALLAATQPH